MCTDHIADGVGIPRSGAPPFFALSVAGSFRHRVPDVTRSDGYAFFYVDVSFDFVDAFHGGRLAVQVCTGVILFITFSLSLFVISHPAFGSGIFFFFIGITTPRRAIKFDMFLRGDRV